MRKVRIGFKSLLVLVIFIVTTVTAVGMGLMNASSSKKQLEEDTFKQLQITAEGLATYYANVYNTTGGFVYEHEYVDKFVEDGIVLTVFNENVRHMTSIKVNNKRLEGTRADDIIYEKVKSGNIYRGHNVVIGDEEYYVVYVPMYSGAGDFIGMGFAGEKEETINSYIRSSTFKILAISAIITVVFSLVGLGVAIAMCRSIDSIRGFIKDVANGKLKTDKEPHSRIKQLRDIIDDVSYLRENLVDTLSEVVQLSGSISSDMSAIKGNISTCSAACKDISKAVDGITSGANEMAENTQNTAEQVESISGNVNEITIATAACDENILAMEKDTKDAMSSLADLIKENSLTSEAVKDVIANIHGMVEAIDQIQKASDVIAEVTDQTSLLALNASIEAARAGDAGRGFAVVASEISNLAKLCESATIEIQKIVKDIVSSSKSSAETAMRVGEEVSSESVTLNKVIDDFGKVDNAMRKTVDAVNTIVGQTESLSTATCSIVDDVASLSSISEENAASCEETNASIEELTATFETIDVVASDVDSNIERLNNKLKFFDV